MRLRVTFQDVARAIEDFAPLRLQESYDNSGLLVGEADTTVEGVLLCLDVSMAVLEEAATLGCNLIISHHPLIFHSIKSLRGDSETSRIVLAAARQRIGIIAAHTNLDSAFGGVSYALAEKLGVCGLKPLAAKRRELVKVVTYVPEEHLAEVRQALFDAGAGYIGKYSGCSFMSQGTGTFFAPEGTSPYVGTPLEATYAPEVRLETIVQEELREGVVSALLRAHPYEEPAYDLFPLKNHAAAGGLGVVGTLPAPLEEENFLSLVQEKLSTPCIRHSALTGRTVQRVALCGGSGMEFFPLALTAKVDAYITADVKYHDFQRPESRLLLLDVGHRESEMVAVEILEKIVKGKFTTFAVQKSARDANPVHYFINSK